MKKNEPSRRIIKQCLIPLTILVLTTSCQRDVENVTSPTSTIDSGIINLKYEVETLTIPHLNNADNATSQQKIQAMAFSERSKIQLSIYVDGTSAWHMEKLKPKHDLSVQHETPPSDLPEVKVTEIDRAGSGHFYDSKGTLLFTHNVTMGWFKDVVENVKENPNAIFTAMGVNTADNVKKILARGKLNGSVIKDLGNGMVSVRSAENKIESNALRQKSETDAYTTVDIFNSSLGIMIGSTLYNDQQKKVSETFYEYEYNTQNLLVPKAAFLKTWDIDPVSAQETSTETYTYFDNVTATLNLN